MSPYRTGTVNYALPSGPTSRVTVPIQVYAFTVDHYYQLVYTKRNIVDLTEWIIPLL